MASLSQITVFQLARLIGTAEVPVILDVCIDEDFDADPRLIPTARRHPHDAIQALVPELAGARVLVVCQKGLKLSQGAAALLRCEGIAAVYLEGGNFAWRDAEQPVLPAAKLPVRTFQSQSLWVTAQRPGIGRMACAWLIRRFLDTNARFLSVQASEVSRIAEKFGATPFGGAGVSGSSRRELCNFAVMLDEFALGYAALNRLETVVRGAGAERLEPAPESAGLLAASLGLSQIHLDDVALLESGMALFDAFYRWARDAQKIHCNPAETRGGP